MPKHWLIERNGQLWGPFSVDELHDLVCSGQLQLNEMVLPEDGNRKIAVATVPGLAEAAANGARSRAATALLPPADRRPRQRKWLVFGLAAAAVLVILVVLWNVFL